jgi:RAT1-interacting protein
MLSCGSNASDGISTFLLAFRNDAGILVRTERLRTKDITQKVKAKNYWQVR